MGDEVEGEPKAAAPNGITYDQLLKWLAPLITAAVAWYCSTVYGQVEQLRKDFNEHLVAAAEKADQYVRKDDLADIKERLTRIEGKLDEKADKAR